MLTRWPPTEHEETKENHHLKAIYWLPSVEGSGACWGLAGGLVIIERRLPFVSQVSRWPHDSLVQLLNAQLEIRYALC